MRLAFITATPLNVVRGSGTFAGIRTLATSLKAVGVEVEIVAPRLRLPVYTAERLLFNEQLRYRDLSGSDAIVGFDMDGYRIAGRSRIPHVASIKGVIADEMRFEHGLTRWTMGLQAACEAIHVRRARRVITTSEYAALRLRQLYGLRKTPEVVPEGIDLAAWRRLFACNPGRRDPDKFTVFCVCRFYRRKRLPVLLAAAARLSGRIPHLEVRIAGGGPEAGKLRRISRDAGLDGVVRWLGNVAQDQLAAEYNGADVFCLPSVQEGFGIVFLEAMAAGVPIVAARAAAVPEVVRHGLLAEPDDASSLADALERLYHDADLRRSLAEEAQRDLERFDAPVVARSFLRQVEELM